ncbi:MAG: SCO family protein [Gammaproteobacteria bacterium]|nr:MAG: SCO family protein [Gammaproteobacteria bacterium]
MKDLFRNPVFALVALVILAVLGTALYRINQPPGLPELLKGPERVTTTAGEIPLKDLFGPVTVVFFGFTNCPDVCPTTLSVVSRAYKQLPDEQQANLRVLFVTLDPERDTLEAMKPYVDFFGDRVQGVVLPPEHLSRWVKTFRIFYEKVDLPDSEMGYTINHTAAFFIVRDGQWPASVMTSHDVPAVTQALARAFE